MTNGLFRQWTKGWRLLVPLLLIIQCLGCGGHNDGLKKYPVHGRVLVDGEPEAGIIVRFVRSATSPSKANGQFPVGVTDDDGEFRLGTNGVGDGAVEGDYTITFIWPEQNEPPPGDFLKGAYSNPANSKFRATILPEDNDLSTFELKKPASSASSRPRD